MISIILISVLTLVLTLILILIPILISMLISILIIILIKKKYQENNKIVLKKNKGSTKKSTKRAIKEIPKSCIISTERRIKNYQKKDDERSIKIAMKKH